jgi:hypothetical protein
MQLYTSANECEGLGNIPEHHFVKVFSALCRFLNVNIIAKSAIPSTEI